MTTCVRNDETTMTEDLNPPFVRSSTEKGPRDWGLRQDTEQSAILIRHGPPGPWQGKKLSGELLRRLRDLHCKRQKVVKGGNTSSAVQLGALLGCCGSLLGYFQHPPGRRRQRPASFFVFHGSLYLTFPGTSTSTPLPECQNPVPIV
ncbi:hypothetical protein CORC01_12613 [Colletotrichum orchidophilum]|uniref:Uncharacterized protein n=1 Tax=Colletotrichum orchidophilum TaxID=1209926 RepID=A0A1G4ASF9_9PEZI|nr:uncharacterized protein CORC01_12613 [Colletotrichum orchidophilum]OHE92098.1 hypothetical protein CORC01_12613 [Colletotrichum orchidophilum]